MDLPFTKHQYFQNFMMKCWTFLKKMNLNLKKNSVSKKMVILAMILVVLIVTYFTTILGLVVAFAIGKYYSNNHYGSNNKAEKHDGTSSST